MLRWIMVESARVASVHDPRLKSFYERVKGRRGGPEGDRSGGEQDAEDNLVHADKKGGISVHQQEYVRQKA